MVWLELPQVVVYVSGIVGCSWLAWRLMTGRVPARLLLALGRALSASALLGGAAITAFSIPDWNPIAVLWLFLPYVAFSLWAFYFSLLIARGYDPWPAGRRALAWTYPSLLVAPLLVAAVTIVIASV